MIYVVKKHLAQEIVNEAMYRNAVDDADKAFANKIITLPHFVCEVHLEETEIRQLKGMDKWLLH